MFELLGILETGNWEGTFLVNAGIREVIFLVLVKLGDSSLVNVPWRSNGGVTTKKIISSKRLLD